MHHGSDAPTRYSDGRRIIRSLGLFFFCVCKHVTITPTSLSVWASDNPVLKSAPWFPKHALWYMIRRLADALHLHESDHPVLLGFLQLRRCNLHRCSCVGLSGGNRILRCHRVGSSGATESSRTRPFQRFFEFFLRVLLCLAFLFHP